MASEKKEKLFRFLRDRLNKEDFDKAWELYDLQFGSGLSEPSAANGAADEALFHTRFPGAARIKQAW
jgi:hypothetical protein